MKHILREIDTACGPKPSLFWSKFLPHQALKIAHIEMT